MSIRHKILSLYLFLVCGIVPVYIPNGYEGLGESKFICYRLFSIACFAVFVFSYLYDKEFTTPKKELFPKLLLVSFLFSAISFFLSIDRNEALWGANGWRMGFLTECLMLVFLFCSSCIL